VGFFFKVLKMKQKINNNNFLQMAQTWCYKQCLLRGQKSVSGGKCSGGGAPMAAFLIGGLACL